MAAALDVGSNGTEEALLLGEVNIDISVQCETAAVATTTASAAAAQANIGFPLDRWMGALSDCIGNKTVCEICLPGAHNSGAYESTRTFSPEAPGFLDGSCPCSCGDACIECVSIPLVRPWCECQKELRSQLCAGVRYLDVRLGYAPAIAIANGGAGDGELFLCHGLKMVSLQAYLDTLLAFLKEGRDKEIFILDMPLTHARDVEHQADLFEDGMMQLLIQQLTFTFGSRLAPVKDWTNLTISQIWKQGWNVLVSTGGDFPSPFASRGQVIHSPWANTCDRTVLKKFLQEASKSESALRGRLNGAARVFVLQGILTPDTGTVASSILCRLFCCCLCCCFTSIQTKSKSLNEALGDWISTWKAEGACCINVVLADYIDETLSRSIIELNLGSRRE